MKHLILVSIMMVFGSNAFAEISCVTPYGSSKALKPVEKLLIDFQENRYFVRFPVESECTSVDEDTLNCQVEIDSKNYEAIFSLSIAAGEHYQEAGEISTDRFLFWHSQSPIYCKTVE